MFKPGDEVLALPSGFKSIIKSIHTADGDLEEAHAPQSVTITLDDKIDISRGDMIVKANNPPTSTQDIEAMVCWFSERPLAVRGKYIIRHTEQETKAMVESLDYQVDVNTFHKQEEVKTLGMNDIGRIRLRTAKALHVDAYNKNRHTGSFILVDTSTNETVAAGMIV